MRWNVEGADAQTGRDRLVTVEADDPKQAEVAARMKGLLVSAVHPVKILSPVEKLEQMMAGKLDASAITSTHINEEMTDAAANVMANMQPTPAAIPQPNLEYRSAPLPMRFVTGNAIPTYSGLRIASVLLMICAILAYLAGILSLALTALSMIHSAYFGNTPAAMANMVVGFITTLTPLAVGAVFHAMSAACGALRDIARNSFAK